MLSDALVTTQRTPGLTLGHMMGAVAVLAFAFAFLPWELSGPLAVAVLGILVLQGLRLPLLTEGGGLKAWILWISFFLALAVCPIATIIVGSVYERVGPPAFNGPRPWATRVVDKLAMAHLIASVVASMAVVLLARGAVRWLAWGAIVVILVFTGMVVLGAAMSTSGVYL